MFFSDFFTWLIVSDIVILLVSYKHITDFPQLARNTGFILSTVIIRVGIGIPGFTGAILFILSAALASCVLRLSLHSNQGLESEEYDYSSKQRVNKGDQSQPASNRKRLIRCFVK